jgi:hypothetical protein
MMFLYSYKGRTVRQAVLGLVLMLAGTAAASGPWPAVPADWRVQRERMVETQIRGRGIADRKVLSALGRVERHRFVPES